MYDKTDDACIACCKGIDISTCALSYNVIHADQPIGRTDAS